MAPFEQATRAQIVTLKAIGQTTAEVIAITGLKERTIQSIYSRAIERGFDPAIRPIVILNKHVEDAPRLGRPTKQTPEIQQLAIL
jgi:hypothetical protein